MNSQATPPNINEPYAKNLVSIIASVVAFLTVRHVLIYLYNKCKHSTRFRFLWSVSNPFASQYSQLENIIVNKCSYSPLNGMCPPVGAFFLVCALISAILPLLLLNVDLTVNSNRAGFLALAMVPFLLSSAGKNSAFSFVTGISSVRMNWIHRVLGMMLMVCATVHMAPMLYAWNKFPTFMKSQLQLVKVQYGLAGYGALCVVFLGSLFPVRKYAYEFFLGTHVLGLVFIGLIATHTPYAMRYFVTGLFCYSLNLVAVWFVKTFMAHARFDILPEGCTKISIRLASPMKTHYIGQHINLCIPAISCFQWHPFTITSVQQQSAFHHNSIEVHVVSRGNFTSALYNKVDASQELSVFVSGPFGSPSIRSMDILLNKTTVVIATGGAGITFGMRLLREITDTLMAFEESNDQDDTSERDLLNHWKTNDIYFYWSVHRPLELTWFREELEQIHVLYDTHAQFPQLHVQLLVTGTSSEERSDIHELVEPKDKQEEIKKSIETCHGRRIHAASVLSPATDIGAYGKLA